LREEKAIEARGGSSEPVQAVFDLQSGEFTSTASTSSPDSADGRDGATADGGERDPEAILAEAYGEDAPDVLAALSDLDVSEVPPVELMARVQEWQESLED
jgi:DNA mismatch repair protein MutS